MNAILVQAVKPRGTRALRHESERLLTSSYFFGVYRPNSAFPLSFSFFFPLSVWVYKYLYVKTGLSVISSFFLFFSERFLL